MSQVVVCSLSVIFLNAVTCKLLFAYIFFFFSLLWPFLLDIFLLFLTSALHPLSPMHTLSQGLPSDVPLDSSKSDTHRMRGEQGLGIHSPGFLPGGHQQSACVIHGRWAIWQPSPHSCFLWL